MAWSVYPSGNALIPNQAEYYSNWNANDQTYGRNNPNHVMLGNMNYIYVEDMGGIQPRSDNNIELWPIELGYDYFMVNNLRYHNNDITIVWDKDGSHYNMGQGYLLFINGELKAKSDKLGRFVYDPAANEIVEKDDGLVVTTGDSGEDVPSAIDTVIDDARVVSYLKTAGIDLEEPAQNIAKGASLSSSQMQQGARSTPWRQFHTTGWNTGSMNYMPGAINTTERPVSLDAVTDGNTVNEPYWGNSGVRATDGYIELDFGEAKSFDNVKVWFVSDRQDGGYSEPARFQIQVQDEGGNWVAIPETFKSPKIPTAKFNEALFPTVTADKVRVAFTNKASLYTAISEIQVFDSGREVPAVENDPPSVTVGEDAARAGNISAGLTATVTDDGIPEDGTLTTRWSVVSSPEGAGVIISAPEALVTTVTGTIEGRYVFRLSANDGELTTERDIEVNLTKKNLSAEFGSRAHITTSGTAAWENHNMVNNASDPSRSNSANNGWGNWGQNANGTSLTRAAWIQYTWDDPVRVDSTRIYWYDDNGGTRAPNGNTWSVQYTTDGDDWEDVQLRDGSTYANGVGLNRYNTINFEPVDAKAMRIRVWGVQGQGAGTGVLRWRVDGENVKEFASPIIMRTGVGMIPEMPESLDVIYESGARGSVPFQWQEITDEMVAETNVDPFIIYGTNSMYGLVAEGQIYVRPEMSQGGISIQGAEQFAQSVAVGETPWFPKTALVSYNDGSRDNQAVGIDWKFDPSVIERDGVYTIVGDLILPDYVGTAGTTSTIMVLTVGEGVSESPVKVVGTTRCVAGKTTIVATVTNEGDTAREVMISSEYGSKLVTVAPGKSASAPFSTRATSIDAVDVVATIQGGELDGLSSSAVIDAKSCS